MPRCYLRVGESALAVHLVLLEVSRVEGAVGESEGAEAIVPAGGASKAVGEDAGARALPAVSAVPAVAAVRTSREPMREDSYEAPISGVATRAHAKQVAARNVEAARG